MHLGKILLVSSITATPFCCCVACNKSQQYIDIRDVNDFINIKDLNGSYRLINDLDFNNQTINSIGDYNHPFKGIFEGNGHTISNFQINKNAGMGLFGCTDAAIIKNVNVVSDLDVEGIETGSVGLLVGYANNTTIEHCSSVGSIALSTTSRELGSNVGGLVGYANISNINFNYAKVKITVSSPATCYVGGLIGYHGKEKNINSTITNCYAYDTQIYAMSSSAGASCYVGGLIGKNCATVNKCFTHHMELTSSSEQHNVFVGGVIGDNNDGIVSNCLGASNLQYQANNGTIHCGLVNGRNFSSDTYKKRGLSINNYCSSFATYKYVSGSEMTPIESTSYNIAYIKNMRSTLWYKEILGITTLFYKTGCFPSLKENEFTYVCEDEQAIPEGMPEKPINIDSIDILKNIDVNKSYKLTKDLSFGDETPTPIGTYEKPYRGVFDGNLHTITFNAKINTTTEERKVNVGLFGYLNGIVKDLELKTSFTIDSTNERTFYVGSLAGDAYDSIITNTHAVINNQQQNSISAHDLMFGGLIGRAENCLIYHCCAISTKMTVLSSKSDTAIYGGLIGGIKATNLYESFAKVSMKFIPKIAENANWVRIGGLIGNCRDCIVNNVYAIGTIDVAQAKGKIYAGGIVGFHQKSDLTNSFTKTEINFGDLIKDSLVGGIIGYNDNGVDIAVIYENIVKNCFFDANQKITHSCGASNSVVFTTRVHDQDLINLATKISDKFYTGEDGLPHLTFERRAY